MQNPIDRDSLTTPPRIWRVGVALVAHSGENLSRDRRVAGAQVARHCRLLGALPSRVAPLSLGVP